MRNDDIGERGTRANPAPDVDANYRPSKPAMTDKEKAVEAAARVLCKRDGGNPDQLVHYEQGQPGKLRRDPIRDEYVGVKREDGKIIEQWPTIPLWEWKYKTEATLAIEAALPHLQAAQTWEQPPRDAVDVALKVFQELRYTTNVSDREIVQAMLAALPSRDVSEALEEAKALNLVLSEAVVIDDSYGVEGSSFSTCLVCQAGGAPGIPFIHSKSCPVGRAEEAAHQWCVEHREEVKELEEEIAQLKADLASAIPAPEQQTEAK